MSMQPFEKFSYRGKTRRLRQLAMNALLRYPMEVASVHLIEAFTNANYRVKTRDGDSYFIRVCEPGLIEGVNRTAYDAPHELTTEIAELAPILGKFLESGVLEKVASCSG